MQYRVYSRQKLEYVDGGYVKSWNIDDDYIVNNNSTISVVKKIPITKKERATVTASGTYEIYKEYAITNIVIVSGNVTSITYIGNKYTVIVNGTAELDIYYEIKNTLSLVSVGDIVALIETSGAYHKGVITAVDDTALTISYKSDKELFNDNMLNPLRTEFVTEGGSPIKVATKFGIQYVVMILKSLFSDTADEYKKLPLVFETNGDALDENGNPKMLWTWSNDSISITDWLTELFEKYNVSLSWSIDFNIAEENLEKRQPRYIVTLSAITNSGGIIKDNVDMQTITYTAKELPDATVCYVIDDSTKELLTGNGKDAIYYLAENNGIYYVTQDKNDTKRILPVKTVVATFNQNSESAGDTTPENAATDKLIPSQFNQAIEIRISADSKMFDFQNSQFGDLYKVINKQGTIDSVFTGKKFSNADKWVTLYFGLGRQNYTDLIQIRLRKQRYNQVYNQR